MGIQTPWTQSGQTTDGEIFATFPKVPGAVAYDVYAGPGGTSVLDVYIPPSTKPVRVGRFDKDGKRIETP